jgi:hypothetical protein
MGVLMLNLLVPAVTSLLDKFIEDKDEKAKLAHEIATMSQKMAHKSAMAQIEVNKEDAKGNWFQAGWRPFVGWTCGFALFYHFILQPMLTFGLTVYGISVELPEFDMNSLMTVLLGMLGLGGLRSFERVKKVGKQ